MSEASLAREVIGRLQAMSVPFRLYEHEAANTMEDCEAMPFAGPGLTFCKNLLLCNRQQTLFWYFLMPARKPFRTAAVSKALDCSRLSFAPHERLTELLRTPMGSLAPFGLWYDERKLVRFAADRDVRLTPEIAFHPCDNTMTLVFDQAVFWEQVLPSLNHPLTWVSFSAE